MPVYALKGNDAEDKEQGRGAYVNAILRGLEAEEKFPALKQQPHLDNVKDVKSEVVGFTKFVERNTSKSSNFYENSRIKLPHLNVAGTALKFDFFGQRNFTQMDATNLENHLKSVLPNVNLNVYFGVGKARCVVHVGL